MGVGQYVPRKTYKFSFLHRIVHRRNKTPEVQRGERRRRPERTKLIFPNATKTELGHTSGCHSRRTSRVGISVLSAAVWGTKVPTRCEIGCLAGNFHCAHRTHTKSSDSDHFDALCVQNSREKSESFGSFFYFTVFSGQQNGSNRSKHTTNKKDCASFDFRISTFSHIEFWCA